LLSSVSFALNPLFIVLFFGYLFWMGLAAYKTGDRQDDHLRTMNR
jgi:hypothetical protein